MTAEVTGIIAFVMNVAEGLARLKSMHAINFRDMRDEKKTTKERKKLCSYIHHKKLHSGKMSIEPKK